MTIDHDLLISILERTDQKLDDLIQRISDQGAVITIQSANISQYNEHLKEHMRRTDLLEQRVEPLEQDLTTRQLKKSFITAHWKQIAVIASFITGLAGLVWTIMQITGNS